MNLKHNSFIYMLYILTTCGVPTNFRNNVCKDFEDYSTAAVNENCFYDEDVSLKTPDLIKKYTGTVENYTVETEDGYTLTMFRIPKHNAKGVILMQHALGTDSRVYVGLGKDSFAFYLWRAGYEIWLNNQRGTFYSEKHKTMTTSDFDYWNFSFHEIALYDVSSQIKFIKRKTRRKIIFLGYSLGSTIGLIYASQKHKEAEESLEALILMSVPCYFKYNSNFIVSILKTIQIEPFLRILQTFNIGFVWLLIPELVQLSSRMLFRTFPSLLSLLNLLLNIAGGWSLDETDPRIINFDTANLLNNVPWKIFLHYLQIIKAKTRFQMFDYGNIKNFKIYNQSNPPLYTLENISVPVYLTSSLTDTLTTSKDTQYLFDQLPESAKIYGQLIVSGFNHYHVLFGKHTVSVYYEKIVDLLYYNITKENNQK